MARHALPPIGHSIHGQSKVELMRLHQQSLERTLNNTLTIIDEKHEQQKQQRIHNKKKKKYYPWLQRDSLTQREKIGLEGSRRRQRHDNGKSTYPPVYFFFFGHYKFIHHPMAVLYAVDMPFPGYGHDAPSFHWKYDAMIDSLIRNNPPSSRRSKVANEDDDVTASGPMIGHRCLTRAQRKDIKKVHVPQGIVMQYEGELVGFLDQLSPSTSTSSSSSDAYNSETQEEDEDEGNDDDDDDVSEPELVASSDSTDGDDQVDAKSNWVFVQRPKEPSVAPSERDGSSSLEKEAEVEQDRPQVYLRWDIPDQFLRFVAHALCSFYGLVSFSKTADGKRWVYICHPTHLDSIGPLSRQKALEHVQELPMPELEKLWGTIDAKKVDNLRPDMTFFEYLYPSTRPSF
ncbi:hypothetical protein CPC16_005583 [Podila verticillata]|nr:hypothetical protein CPC16_005583 [Podila verticillata]